MPWMKEVSRPSAADKQVELNTGANLVAFAKTTAFQSGVCSILANLIT